MKNVLVSLMMIIFINKIVIADEPAIKWYIDTKSFAAGMAAAADIDLDNKLEIVFSCYRNDGGIYAVNAEDGSLLWSYFPHNPAREGCNDAAPLIYDTNGDGMLEVVVASSCTPKTICLNGKNGSLIWEENTRGSDSPPSISRSNNNKLIILHGEFNGWVRAIDAESGITAWELPINLNSWIQTAPTIADLNNDSELDFVVATWAFDNKDSVHAFNLNTQKKLWSIPINGHVYHGSAVADLDKDNKPEILFGTYNDTLYCLNGEDGSINWTYEGPGAITCPVVIADIDNDGECDILFSSWYKFIALNSSGSVKWEYTIPNYSSNFRGASIADINNDNYKDVVFGTMDGNLIALNGNNGSPIFVKDLRAHYGAQEFDINHAPLIADFDNDSELETFVVGGWGVSSPSIDNNYGRAYMLDLGKGKGPDWLMFQNSPTRQSSLCNTDINSIIENNIYTENNDIKILINEYSNYLNISIKSELFNQFGNSIRIYNSQGECIEFIDTSLRSFASKIDISHLPTGLYFIQIGDYSEKFVVVR